MMRNKRTNIGKTREPLRKMEMITTECCYIQLGAKVHNSKSDNLFIMISLRFRSNRNLCCFFLFAKILKSCLILILYDQQFWTQNFLVVENTRAICCCALATIWWVQIWLYFGCSGQTPNKCTLWLLLDLMLILLVIVLGFFCFSTRYSWGCYETNRNHIFMSQILFCQVTYRHSFPMALIPGEKKLSSVFNIGYQVLRLSHIRIWFRLRR